MNRGTIEIAGFLLVLGVMRVPLAAQQPPSEETIAFFKQNCQSCHTIGGGVLTGPDLKDVTKRRKREWLVKFIRNPKAVIDSGDAYALKLVKAAKGQIMPTIPGITPERARKLIDLIEAESKLEKSHFAGTRISDRPLTPEDVVFGRELFLGVRHFENGAPACISCHSIDGLPGYGGGHLGPDLTMAYARLEGRKALGAWLTAPPSLVMQPVFYGHELTEDEILGLVAYLKDVAETGERNEAESASLEFLLTGVGVAAFLLLLFDFFWRRRFRAVRSRMVAKD